MQLKGGRLGSVITYPPRFAVIYLMTLKLQKTQKSALLLPKTKTLCQIYIPIQRIYEIAVCLVVVF